jgi:hypothetical protein
MGGEDSGPRRRVSDRHAISRAAVNPFTLVATMLSLGGALIGVTLFLVQADHTNEQMGRENQIQIQNLERVRGEDKSRREADVQEIKEELGSIDAKLDALLLQMSNRHNQD